MQPVQKRNTRTSCKIHYACSQSKKQPPRSHSNAICVVASKPNLDAKAKKKFDALLKMILRRKITGAKMEKKRILCETSFKTPLATHPPAPLGIPFTFRERSYLQNTIEFFRTRMHGKNLKPYLQCGTGRPWSDHVAHPSHCKTFEDAFCLEEYRISCICYLSKTHFVWDFLQIPSATHPPAPLAIPFTLREQFLWLTRSPKNTFFATCFFSLFLTTSFLANSFFDYLTDPDQLFLWLTLSLTNSFFD